jgi:hypothetical protein
MRDSDARRGAGALTLILYSLSFSRRDPFRDHLRKRTEDIETHLRDLCQKTEKRAEELFHQSW